MTQQFQLSLLCYLVQSERGKSFVEAINEEIFEFTEFKLTSQILKRYYGTHGRMPGELEAQAFLADVIESTPELPEKTIKDLGEVFEDIYVPLDKRDLDYVESQLVANLQEKQIEVESSRFAKGEISGDEFVEKMSSLSSLAVPGQENFYKNSGFIVADRDKHIDEEIEGTPTFLNDLNFMTAANGFYSPELIVFMSGPKHFKTGIILSIVINLARTGSKVYYADIENGARAIRNRIKMAIMDCELRELYDGTYTTEEISECLERFGFFMGGDIFVDNYPANSKSVQDVEDRLAYLKEKYDFVPDVIVWDPLDKFEPSKRDDKRKDGRIKSQIVYHEAINLNSKLGCWGITPSQVNRKAISKKTLDMADIAEDFGRVMIAHAVFAICATDEEKEDGIRRLIPVAQREGVPYNGKNKCLVKINEATMKVEEWAEDEYLEEVEDD